MGSLTVQQMAERVSVLLEERLKIAGANLPEKLRRGGKRLPRGVLASAHHLSEAFEMAENPRLFMQIDQARLAQDYDNCLRHLSKLKRWERRRAFLETWALSAMVTLAVVGGLVALVLRWRGYI